MPDRFEKSPAVMSLENENAYRSSGSDRLSFGLEETFPASDALSTTTSSMAGSPTETADVAKMSDADLTMTATLEMVESRARQEQAKRIQSELQMMRKEVARLKHIVPQTAASKMFNNGGTPDVYQRLENQIQIHPIAAVGSAMIFGYVWGVLR